MATETLDDLRADLGDSNNAFSEDELTRLLERAAGNHYVALAMGLFQLTTQSARFADYVVNEGQERRSEIWNQLKGSYDLLMTRPDVKVALGENSGVGGGMQTRKLSYTHTRQPGGEYSRPDWV